MIIPFRGCKDRYNLLYCNDIQLFLPCFCVYDAKIVPLHRKNRPHGVQTANEIASAPGTVCLCLNYIGIICETSGTLQLLPMWIMGKQRSLTRCFWPETSSEATKAQVN